MVINDQEKIIKKRPALAGRFFCLVLFLSPNNFLFSQGVDGFTNSFKSKRSFYFNWDSKITFVSNEIAQVKSIKLGFDFGGKTKFGLGYNWYKGDITRTFLNESKSFEGALKFRYASIFTEYVYFLDKRWEATIPAQIGAGIMQYNALDAKTRIAGTNGVFFLYEASSTLVYRFLRYFGVGLGIGFRLVVLTGPNEYGENLQSPIIMIRTKMYFDHIIADFKKRFR